MIILNFNNLNQLMLSNINMFPNYNNLTIDLQYGVNGQLKNTLAEHAFFSDYNNKVLDFFISNIFTNGDINNDGSINVSDIIITVNLILRSPTSLPIYSKI